MQRRLRFVPRTVEPFDVQVYLKSEKTKLSPIFTTNFGALFNSDCMTVLPKIQDEVVDTIFADPPFNLGKKYGKNTDDKKKDNEYLEWCFEWLSECVRVLKPGGALFLYNLPKWNVLLGTFLFQQQMEFRHWIAVEINSTLPIQGRLYPSHYSLLYYSKGAQRVFRRIRTPIQRCRHCGKEIKDYGGHRNAMNPKGVTLKDVWTDVPPVRHWKFKSKNRRCNALSTKILDRVIEMSTAPGDLVLDPFGGSGTTYVVAESRNRNWIGIEIDFCVEIEERFENGEIHFHHNSDFVEV